MIDSHAHLSSEAYTDQERTTIIEGLGKHGLTAVVAVVDVATQPQEFTVSCQLSDEWDEVYTALGIQPHDADQVDDKTLATIHYLAKTHRKIVAIGETGLDYKHAKASPDQQKNALRAQVTLAQELKLPVIIHCREIFIDLFAILDSFPAATLPPILLHSFTGDTKIAQAALARGYYLSFSGILTFNTAQAIQAAAQIIPADHLLIETDCPFLTPVPKRGQRNEPAFLSYTAAFLAKLRGVSLTEIDQLTTANSQAFFRLPS